MLKKVDWPDTRTYRTGAENLPIEFYLQSLGASKSLDLLLGYFSSSAINVLSIGFAKFLYRGGKVKMVINNILSIQDRDAVQKGMDGNVENISFDLTDIKGIKRSLDDYGEHFFNCLSWLIAYNRIEIKIIKPMEGDGIAHYKSGVFRDGQNSIGFKASTNFTANGLMANLEEVFSFLDWDDNRSSKIIDDQNDYFNLIFNGKADFVEYLDTESIITAIKNEFSVQEIDDLLTKEKELLQRKQNLFDNTKLRAVYEQAIVELEEINREPKFPYSEGPRSYQLEAYQNWVKNDKKGIFAMATGTGKTITSLNCVLEEFYQDPGKQYKVLILVPTLTLVEQWEKEVKSFNFKHVYAVSSLTDWEQKVPTMLSTSKRIPTSFIIIATYVSFSKPKFQSLVKDIPSETILIADEAHNLASPTFSNAIKNLSLNKRIGLSATPKRIYDPEGTSGMEAYFNDAEPYTFSYSMELAIKSGILCEYYYFPTIVNLNNDEFDHYIQISKRLAKLARFKAKEETAKLIEMLLLERKRIIHKAENKLPAAIEILRKQFEKNGNLKYTFVYVPEGETSEAIEDSNNSEDDSIKIINQYTRSIGKINSKILVNQFVSGMKDRNEVLDQFEQGIIDVIASMKCLDEGVDIPRAEVAIFCSSTGNPRQFIQRRGRILRKHDDKRFAIIHDLVVIPESVLNSDESETLELEKGLVKNELERVMYFASLSRNPFFTEEVFKDVCEKYDLNIYSIQTELSTI